MSWASIFSGDGTFRSDGGIYEVLGAFRYFVRSYFDGGAFVLYLDDSDVEEVVSVFRNYSKQTQGCDLVVDIL